MANPTRQDKYDAAMADSAAPDASPIERVLDLARWAPSGDNTQTWRFEIVSAMAARIRTFDTRTHCVYDLDGHSSHIAVGALLETVDQASRALGFEAQINRVRIDQDDPLHFEVALKDVQGRRDESLIDAIKSRSVYRRALSRESLSQEDKLAMEAAVGPRYRIHWLESAGDKWQMANLLSLNGKLRLLLPEAHPTHRDIIDWEHDYSPDRIPAHATGLDPMTRRLTRWALAEWRRVDFLNTWAMGTLIPRFELDFWPGLSCGAHILLESLDTLAETDRVETYLQDGRAVQRFWLAATNRDIRHQPAVTSLVFSRYAASNRSFTTRAGLGKLGLEVSGRLHEVCSGRSIGRVAWLGRVGRIRSSVAKKAPRSVRHTLASLVRNERR